MGPWFSALELQGPVFSSIAHLLHLIVVILCTNAISWILGRQLKPCKTELPVFVYNVAHLVNVYFAHPIVQ